MSNSAIRQAHKTKRYQRTSWGFMCQKVSKTKPKPSPRETKLLKAQQRSHMPHMETFLEKGEHFVFWRVDNKFKMYGYSGAIQYAGEMELVSCRVFLLCYTLQRKRRAIMYFIPLANSFAWINHKSHTWRTLSTQRKEERNVVICRWKLTPQRPSPKPPLFSTITKNITVVHNR